MMEIIEWEKGWMGAGIYLGRVTYFPPPIFRDTEYKLIYDFYFI